MFNIPVKIEGIEKRKRSVGLFHTLAALFLVVHAGKFYEYLNYSNFWTLLPFYLIAVASLVYGLFRKSIDPDFKYSQSLRVLQFLIFLAFALFVISSGNAIRSVSLFLWAGICLALLFSERQILHQPFIKISHVGISTPGSFSTKQIDWDSLESVVVRRDYITLNYSNNKYLQFEILKMLTGTEIEQINLFCSEKVGQPETRKEGNSGE